eukprot:scaffold1144_cov215-Pinguiococcus_pyrenoidosus.AAC.3
MFFERLSSDAVAAVIQAQQEAKSMGSDQVGTEHLLLGLLAHPETAGKALRKAGLNSPDQVRGEVASLPGNVAPPKAAGALGDFFSSGGSKDSKGDMGEMLPFTGTARKAFDVSMKEAEAIKCEGIGSELLLVGTLGGSTDSSAVVVLKNLNVDTDSLLEDLREAAKSAPSLVMAGKKSNAHSGSNSVLEEFCTNLNELAEQGEIDPVIGRDEELQRLATVLVRRRKNNACLVGDPGVGKTAIAEGLALNIVEGRVPARLRNSTVLSVDLSAMVAGTQYRGAFEERLQRLLDEAKEQRKKGESVILFIDELHNLLGAGRADGSMDAANMLKPALARGELQCVGATTMEEYRRYVSKDAALERRFQPLMVEEPSEEECLGILQGLKSRYEEHHSVKYTDDALRAAVTLSNRYISDRFLPDKAIDLVDEAGAIVQMSAMLKDSSILGFESKASAKKEESGSNKVTAEDVASVVARWTGVPVQKLTLDESQSLLTLEGTLAARVLGQMDAVNAVSRAVRRARAGLRAKGRPVASFLFCGPTGVGKTELAKALSGAYYNSEKTMIRLDMSEYMERHTVSRLTGPPPGYIGFEEGGQLTEAVRRSPHALVLLDEIEKAHPDVFNILLQVLDDGRLTDSAGRTVDFSNVMLIMTANVGSRAILRGMAGQDQENSAEEDGEDSAAAPAAVAPKEVSPAERLLAAYDALQDATVDMIRMGNLDAQGEMGIQEILKSIGDQGDQLRSALGVNEVASLDVSAEEGTSSSAASQSSNYDDIVAAVKGELGDIFRPEFLNRLDEVVVFQPLPRQDLQSVARLLVKTVTEMADKELSIEVDVTDKFIDRVVEEGTADVRYGARPLRRAVARLLEDPLAEALMQGFVKTGDGAVVDVSAAGADGRPISIMNMRNRAKRNFAIAEGGGGIEGRNQGANRTSGARSAENDGEPLDTPLPV